MPTQEERLTAVEQAATNTRQFQDQAIRHLRELDSSTTILLGVVQSQGRDIRLIFDQLSEIKATQSDHTAMLAQILTKLDEGK